MFGKHPVFVLFGRQMVHVTLIPDEMIETLSKFVFTMPKIAIFVNVVLLDSGLKAARLFWRARSAGALHVVFG